jgi:tRNA 2-thiocytidine biosynthesis protein TtcA
MADSIRKRISKKITKACIDFSLIAEGDRILIATSGGKDSTTLLLELCSRLGKIGPSHELAAIHIQSDFAKPDARSFLHELSSQVAIPFHFIDIAIEKRLKEGRKLNCYWCSTQRRSALIEFARIHGFNKIALGHHMDDIIETLLMNMLYKGEFSGMPPLVPYEKYPVSIIRPLAYCEEHEIIEYIHQTGLGQYTCTCDFSAHSHRKRIRNEIASLTQGNSTLKRNLFESMRHIKEDYLL